MATNATSARISAYSTMLCAWSRRALMAGAVSNWATLDCTARAVPVTDLACAVALQEINRQRIELPRKLHVRTVARR